MLQALCQMLRAGQGGRARDNAPTLQRGDKRSSFCPAPLSPSVSLSIFGQQKVLFFFFSSLARKPIYHMSTLTHVYVLGISFDISLENHAITLA